MDWVAILLALAGPAVAAAGIIYNHVKSKRDTSKVQTKVAADRAVDEARLQDRLAAMDRRIDAADAKADKVQTGVDDGFKQLQATLNDFAGVLTKVQTTIAVLVDRDERRPSSARRRSAPKTEI